MHGPFPGRVDPWSEIGRYYHQIHSGMIGHLLGQIQRRLLELGYEAGREASLQILERSEPDIYVQREELPEITAWDYTAAAQAISAEPGVAVEWQEPEFDAIYVRDIDSGNLVTIVEIVSPSNKVDGHDIADYRERRERMIRKGVNVVEIDLTRSVKRLLEDVLATTYAYHVAVYLPALVPRIIGFDFGTVLKRIALPLRGEAVPMELQMAYDFAYQQASVAGQIYSDGRYTEAELPFPSLLNATQRWEVLETAQHWIKRLEELR